MADHRAIDNHYLLFHGSKTFNYMGILGQGLRIAPPEAPVTGYMFGKGVYFADVFEKSLSYCYDYSENGINNQVMILSEVACGRPYEKTESEYIEKLKKGFSCTKGLGITAPDYGQMITMPNGVDLPIGKMTDHELGAQGQY